MKHATPAALDRLERADFARRRVSTRAEQQALLRAVRAALSRSGA